MRNLNAETRRRIFEKNDKVEDEYYSPEMDEPVGSLLSLDEVPYDRDLKWCNQATSSRPRKTMGKNTRFFQQVTNITQKSTSEYNQLDEHYRSLDQRKMLYDAQVGRSIAAGPGGRGQHRGGRFQRGRRGGRGPKHQPGQSQNQTQSHQEAPTPPAGSPYGSPEQPGLYVIQPHPSQQVRQTPPSSNRHRSRGNQGTSAPRRGGWSQGHQPQSQEGNAFHHQALRQQQSPHPVPSSRGSRIPTGPCSSSPQLSGQPLQEMGPLFPVYSGEGLPPDSAAQLLTSFPAEAPVQGSCYLQGLPPTPPDRSPALSPELPPQIPVKPLTEATDDMTTALTNEEMSSAAGLNAKASPFVPKFGVNCHAPPAMTQQMLRSPANFSHPMQPRFAT